MASSLLQRYPLVSTSFVYIFILKFLTNTVAKDNVMGGTRRHADCLRRKPPSAEEEDELLVDKERPPKQPRQNEIGYGFHILSYGHLIDCDRQTHHGYTVANLRPYRLRLACYSS